MVRDAPPPDRRLASTSARLPSLRAPHRAICRGCWRLATVRAQCVVVVLVLLWLTPIALPAAAVIPADAPPDVLIINSYAPGYEWSDEMLAGVLSAFHEHDREFEPITLYLDYRRFPDPQREAWLVADVVHKCRVRPPKLIITLDNAAFDFALKYRAELGAEIPLVFGGLNRFAPEMIAGQANITGVSEESDFSGTFELIRHLCPAASHVLVICNQTDSSRETRKVFESFGPAYADRYAFEYYDDWTNAELIERVSQLPDDWVGVILDVTRDVTGHNNYNDPGFSLALATRARRPLFLTSRPPGNNDWSVFPWDGIGGGMIVAEVHGAKVGEIALRVLNGEDADSIPVIRHSPQRLEVDYRQMKRFGFSTRQLPPGARVINPAVTFYQINRSRLILAGAVLVALIAIIVVLLFNILRRKQAERALRQAEEHLRTSQKLEAVGLLAGGVAHDFNNILQVIRGHATFLHETTTGSPVQREDVEAIQVATERAAQLTRQLLAFSRQQPLQAEVIDPNDLVLDMAKMLRRVLGEHIELRVTPLPVPAAVRADRSQLEQILLNLCVNARDAMPGGGQILIELRRTELAALDPDRDPELKPGAYLELRVSDTGCGMTHEVLARLFEPFFTTKAPGKGTGMGLAVVYGVVRQHGGAVRVESAVGRGSVFTILLPLCEGAVPVEARARTAPAFPRGAGTVLLAEDDPQVRAIGARILERNGFRVLLASDGQEAHQLIERHHAEIRLAVLDVIMPKRNGRQVFDYIQSQHPAIRVLFCSGYSAEMLPPEMAPEAGRAIVHKPYSADELLTQVHRLLST